LVLEPPYSLLLLKESLVLKFENYRFFNRHIELRNLGASSDHDQFIPHITISEGTSCDIKSFSLDIPNLDIPSLPVPKFPIILSNEYYGTWKEGR
jgi:hypothetical protein